MDKPRQSFLGLWNISIANLGTAIAFALQQSSMSRIFQTLGADVDKLAILMIAGPVTGLIVQPLVGHYSDRTWGRWGRRRPYFFAGAICSAAALFAMPYAPWLWVAAALLWVLDAALNVTIEPFRAFVGDMVPESQRAEGFAVNTLLGCSGAILGSLAPFLIAAAGVSNTAPPGEVPPSVQISFLIAAVVLIAAVGWTVWRTREYSPQELRAFAPDAPAAETEPLVRPGHGGYWLGAGIALTLLAALTGQEAPLYIPGAALILIGLLRIANRVWPREHAVAHILSDLANMPSMMRRLALTHFLTWCALFIMWPFMTPVITRTVFGATDASSAAYQQGADWVGVLFGAYNAVAALASLVAMPRLAARYGPVRTHMACLAIGALSFAAILLIRDRTLIFLPFAGLGFAWASILIMPYVLLVAAVPAEKFGVYIGIFNVFIVLPQILVAAIMGSILRAWFPGEPVWTMAFAAGAMALASLSMLWLKGADGHAGKPAPPLKEEFAR